MARRKRLSGPLDDYLAGPALETKSALGPSVPIARVAGDAAASAALAELAGALADARSEGRLVERLPLDAVETGWLMRDRASPGQPDDPDLAALVESLRSHGQRSPIEVAETAPGRYGLISGWRRVTALRQLRAETGEARFATVLAFLRRPETAEAAYVAMVEENEIRLGLSFYERARIVAKSVEAGVFPAPQEALRHLFATASRAKRSKVGSFLRIYQVLGDGLRFPEALSERQGLAVAKALEEEPGFAARLQAALARAAPATAEAERDTIAAALAAGAAAPRKAAPATPGTAAPAAEEIRPGVFLSRRAGRVLLSGPGVDAALCERLERWLRGG